MKSRTTRQFWTLYRELPQQMRRLADKAYALWLQDPAHPGLQFKQVDPAESIYSVRIGRNYRALGVLTGDTIVWYWIGKHERYDKKLREEDAAGRYALMSRHKLLPDSTTRIGLGLAALGRPGYINLGHAADLGGDHAVTAMAANAHAVLDAAWAAGIRHFDAARSYGRAEEFLASWLRTRAIDPASVTVGSKWGYTYTADWQVTAAVHEVKEHSVARLRQQIGESRAHLGGYLKLYQIHSATLESGVLENQPVLDELARLRDGGLAIGLSLSGPDQAATLARALEIVAGGEPLFAAVQATWNLLEPSVGPMLAAAHAAGLFVIVKEALANGRLTSRNSDPAFVRQRLLLEEVAAAQDVTADALALAAVLRQPWADIVLSGAATPAQLGSNMAALAVHWPAALEARLAELAEPPAAYWAARSRLAWN